MVSLKILFNVSRFKPRLNWNRFLADLRRGSNSLNSGTDNIFLRLWNIFYPKHCLLKKLLCVFKTTFLWIFFSVFIKLSIYKKSSLSKKCPVYEMSYLWNVLSIKCYLWKSFSMKCPIYEISYPWFCYQWNVPTPKYIYDTVSH